MNEGVRLMLKEKGYQTIDFLFLIVSGFIDQVTGHKNCPKMTSVHVIYSKLISGVMSSNWRKG